MGGQSSSQPADLVASPVPAPSSTHFLIDRVKFFFFFGSGSERVLSVCVRVMIVNVLALNCRQSLVFSLLSWPFFLTAFVICFCFFLSLKRTS